MKRLTIPEVVVARLPLYTQKLNQLLREGRESVIAGDGGSPRDHFSAIPRISHFSVVSGKQGTGYNVIKLLESLRSVLNLDRIWEVALVGVGRLGQALMSYHGFSSTGFEIVMAFDNDPEIIGKSIAGIKVLDVKEMQKQICHREIPIAILTVPALARNCGSDDCVRVKAIMNYTPTTLKGAQRDQTRN